MTVEKLNQSGLDHVKVWSNTYRLKINRKGNLGILYRIPKSNIHQHDSLVSLKKSVYNVNFTASAIKGELLQVSCRFSSVLSKLEDLLYKCI